MSNFRFKISWSVLGLILCSIVNARGYTENIQMPSTQISPSECYDPYSRPRVS